MNRLIAIYDRLRDLSMLSSPYDGMIAIAKESGDKTKVWEKKREEWIESRGIVKVMRDTLKKWLDYHDPEEWWKFASEEGARLAEKLHFNEVDEKEEWVQNQISSYKRMYPFPKELLNGNNN